MPAPPLVPMIDPRLMTQPLVPMSGIAARVQKNVPSRWTASTRCQSSSVVRSVASLWTVGASPAIVDAICAIAMSYPRCTSSGRPSIPLIPALFTRMSSRPWFAATLANTSVTAALSVTSSA